MTNDQPDGSVEIFCSYSHRDEPLRQEFESSVVLLRRRKLVQIWHDRRIDPGDDFARDIDEHLNSADIITLFVSADFLASDYCYEKEMPRALERESRKEALIVPIIVRPCDWSDAPFAHLQVIPTNAVAVTSWPNRDEAWTNVAKGLKIAVQKILITKLDALKTLKPIPVPETFQRDAAEARAIYEQILRDAPAHKAERERISAEMREKIFALDLELGPDSASRLKKPDRAFSNIDKYIRE